MSLVVAVMFLLNSTACAIDLSNNKAHLRVPVGQKSTYDHRVGAIYEELEKGVSRKDLTPEEAEEFQR